MKKVMQQHQIDKENGKHGDCWESCILSITELDRNLLPSINDEKYKNTIDWSDFYWDMITALERHGWELNHVSVKDFKDTGNYVIASGNSPRGGGIKHSVVWNGGIIHDPHQSGDGILTVNYFHYLESMK
jgi:hypothetical protein